jgi:hypothetical protein
VLGVFKYSHVVSSRPLSHLVSREKEVVRAKGARPAEARSTPEKKSDPKQMQERTENTVGKWSCPPFVPRRRPPVGVLYKMRRWPAWGAESTDCGRGKCESEPYALVLSTVC